ncbi:helix-turn-helix domain-containing protein [Brucepastera parasyntrophica]|uniref:helix-turn-helix domain-containing protein n=1 Tax=Brucepastera parasyntrophica TaxID=2880008 RepID=UPI00210BBC1A|nr:helix-turn-helix transcriptional regulator [Brucepastera parasyntrophica]ULQ59660.1 helix-turn-helix domain-containing protein [Brucepastera parasyntrophica]
MNQNKNYDILHIFGENLRRLRKKHRISQLELSSRTDLSHTFINNIENGKKWISPQTLTILCKELHAYPFEFFLTNDLLDSNSVYLALAEKSNLIFELDEIIAKYRKEKPE